jgi:hypothetical protein
MGIVIFGMLKLGLGISMFCIFGMLGIPLPGIPGIPGKGLMPGMDGIVGEKFMSGIEPFGQLLPQPELPMGGIPGIVGTEGTFDQLKGCALPW